MKLPADPDSRPTLEDLLRNPPVQERTRRRVEAILASARRLVVRVGVSNVTTQMIADDVGIPVPSVYHFFEDIESILLAVIAEDADRLDAAMLARVAVMSEEPTVQEVVETVMLSFVEIYGQQPEFVEIAIRGLENPVIQHYGKVHNRQIAAGLHEYAHAVGLGAPELTIERCLFAVEIGDLVFQMAYADDIKGDQTVVAEGIKMMTSYLRRYTAR